MITNAVLQGRYYTYEDWLELEKPDDIWKLELIDGKLYAMAAPSPNHQRVSNELGRQFSNFLLGNPCRVYPGIAIKLAKDTAYVPDLVVVCDSSKLTKHGCEGAPDLAIEILSPSTSRHDRVTKLKAYRKAGVKEYWIVDPVDRIISVHLLANDMYTISSYTEDDEKIPVESVSGLDVDLSTVFQED